MNRGKCPFIIALFVLLGTLLLSSCNDQEPTPTVVLHTPTPSPADAVIEGDSLLRTSDLTGALEAYQRAIDLDPDYSPAYVGVSEVYFWQRDFSQALVQAEKAIELAPGDVEPYIMRSQALIGLRKSSEALESAEEAVSKDPNNARAFAALAIAYVHENQFDPAKEAVENAYRLSPESPEVNHALGIFYEATADYVRAEAAYKNAALFDPDFFVWYIILGLFHNQRDQFDEAIQDINKAAELAPENPDPPVNLAQVKLMQHDYETAETYIKQAIELGLEEVDIYLIQGDLFLAQMEFEDALTQYNLALDIFPEHMFALSAVGETYLWQSECEQAETQFQDLNRTYPQISYFLVGRGYAEVCAGDPYKALDHFRNAVELNPYDYEAQIGLGVAYQMQDRWEDSKKALLEALKISPYSAYIHYELGSWSYFQGYLDDSEIEFQIALDQNPYLVDSYLYLEDVYLYKSQYEKALEIAMQALELDEGYLDSKLYAGIAYYFYGEPEKAVTILEDALHDDPELAASHHYLGLAYRDLGDYNRAKEEIETYQRLMSYYLTDIEHTYLDLLIEALGIGYTLSEEKALEDFEIFLEYMLGWKPEIEIQEFEESGRTLVITLDIPPSLVNSADALVYLGMVASATSYFGPRIDPPITNGLLINFDVWGETQFTGAITLMDIKKFADSLVTADEYVQSIEISILSPTYKPTPFWQIKQSVAELREIDSQQPVSFEIVTSQEYQDLLTESLDEEARESIEYDDEVLTMLGLIPSAMNLEDAWVDLYTEQVAGYYVPGEDTLYVLEQDEPSFEDEITYAHEYVHALQDQEFDLEEMRNLDQNDDQMIALDALIEGDATFASGQYSNQNISILDAFDAATKQIDADYETFESMPYFIQEFSIFPYLAGMDFVYSLYQRGGWDEVDAAYQNPPQSTEQILHPERYWEGEGPTTTPLFESDPVLNSPWQEVDQNVLGELGLRLTLAEHIGPLAGIEGADGWGGDQYRLFYHPEEDQYAWIVRTFWDDQIQSDEFWVLFQKSMEHQSEYTEIVDLMVGDLLSHWWESDQHIIMVSQQEQFVTIVIGPDREVIDQLASEYIVE